MLIFNLSRSTASSNMIQHQSSSTRILWYRLPLIAVFLLLGRTVSALSVQPLKVVDAATATTNLDVVSKSTAPPSSSSSSLSVLILRHGQSDANALDVIQGSGYKSRLTLKGRQQAAQVAQALSDMDIHISHVFCSPLTRAVSTWEIVQTECKDTTTTALLPDATVLQDLREIDFYDWEGIDKTNLNRMFPKEFQAWKQVRPNELVVMNSADATSNKPTRHYPLLELWERADKVWNEILSQVVMKDDDHNKNNNNKKTTILLVAHGSLGQALLGTAMGWDATHFRKHTFPNCGVAEVEWHSNTNLLLQQQQQQSNIDDGANRRRPFASRWRWKYPSSKNHMWNYHHNNDILRDLDGNPLTNEYFETSMNVANVDYFNTPQTDDSAAFRGLMSDGARIQLHPSKQTAFYKRIVFSDLEHAQTKLKKAPFKLLRDTKSYQVVANWLSSKACRMLCDDTGVHIPKCYDAQVRADYTNPMESKFSFLLEDFNPSQGWYQEWLLDETRVIQASLTTLAKIHAYFWHGSNFWNSDEKAKKELEQAIWPSGSYVQPKAQNDNQCYIVAEEWDKKKQAFQDVMGDLPFWDDLGERLESVCVEAGRLAHPFADDLDNCSDGAPLTSSPLAQEYQQFRTFTHGDPKQANFFFRDTEVDDALPEVGLIDFQWSGFGLAATDLAHFLLSSVHADHLIDGGEERWQQYYYEELQAYLVEYGAYASANEVASKFSYETFQSQYDTAVLDLTRLIVSYTWNRFTERVDKGDKEARARTMNKTSYNKSVENAVYLMSRCHGVLQSRGVNIIEAGQVTK